MSVSSGDPDRITSYLALQRQAALRSVNVKEVQRLTTFKGRGVYGQLTEKKLTQLVLSILTEFIALPHIMCHNVIIVVFSIVFTEEYMQAMGCSMDHSKLDFLFLLLNSWTIGNLIQSLVLDIYCNYIFFLSCKIFLSSIEALEITVLEVAIVSKLCSCSFPRSQTCSHSKDILSAYPGPIKGQL